MDNLAYKLRQDLSFIYIFLINCSYRPPKRKPKCYIFASANQGKKKLFLRNFNANCLYYDDNLVIVKSNSKQPEKTKWATLSHSIIAKSFDLSLKKEITEFDISGIFPIFLSNNTFNEQEILKADKIKKKHFSNESFTIFRTE